MAPPPLKKRSGVGAGIAWAPVLPVTPQRPPPAAATANGIYRPEIIKKRLTTYENFNRL
jgi:hypothetical protein